MNEKVLHFQGVDGEEVRTEEAVFVRFEAPLCYYNEECDSDYLAQECGRMVKELAGILEAYKILVEQKPRDVNLHKEDDTLVLEVYFPLETTAKLLVWMDS